MVYYHVISDMPRKEGEYVLPDAEHPNGVYRRVYAQLETVEDIEITEICKVINANV